MTQNRRWGALLLVVLACSCREGKVPDSGSRGLTDAGGRAEPRVTAESVVLREPPIIEEREPPALSPSAASQIIDDFAGDLGTVSPEERSVVDFVDRYLDSWRKPFPRPRKYVVVKTERGWSVTVLDLKALVAERLGAGLTLRIVQESDQYRVIDMLKQ